MSNKKALVFIFFGITSFIAISSGLAMLSANYTTASIATDNSGKPSKVNKREFSIGGIRLGSREKFIYRKLGKPPRVVDDGYSEIQLQYFGLTIFLDRDRTAIGMKSTSDRYCTPAGVCPTLRFSEVRKIYGTPEEVNRDEGRFIQF